MNNYILISRTYCEITPDSAEMGDFSNSGFVDERQEVTFGELVELMQDHREPSRSPDDYNTSTWYSTGFYTADYRTGTEREECIHFHRDNTPNAAKYWKWARIAASNRNK
jgi:hypothetical protein